MENTDNNKDTNKKDTNKKEKKPKKQGKNKIDKPSIIFFIILVIGIIVFIVLQIIKDNNSTITYTTNFDNIEASISMDKDENITLIISSENTIIKSQKGKYKLKSDKKDYKIYDITFEDDDNKATLKTTKNKANLTYNGQSIDFKKEE